MKVFNSVAQRDEFKYHHRLEFEANPHWTIADRLKVNMRNRLEQRWIEDKGSDNRRFRQRTNVELPLKDCLPVQAVYANSEFFYDFADHRYNENWTVPFGIKFRLTDQVSLSTFYMIQHRKGTEDWSSSQVLGTHLMVSF